MDDPLIKGLQALADFLHPPTQKDYALQPGQHSPAPICASIIDGKTCREPLHHDAYKHERVVTPGARERMYGTLDPVASEREFCERGTCRQEIEVMAHKGTGYCSTNCAKIAKGERPAAKVALPPAVTS